MSIIARVVSLVWPDCHQFITPSVHLCLQRDGGALTAKTCSRWLH